MGWEPEESVREANLKKLRERKEKAKALLIQAKADTENAKLARRRKRAAEKRRQREAATRVQAVTRGHAARRRSQHETQQHRENAAAVKLQATYRGKTIRAHTGDPLDDLRKHANHVIDRNLADLDEYFQVVEARLRREAAERGETYTPNQVTRAPALPSWDNAALPSWDTGRFDNASTPFEEVDDVRIDAAISSIRDSLLENLPRVVDIFRNFDVDGSGTVSREEFLRVLPLMRNVDVSDDELDLLFDAIDRDGSGEIELRELQKVMRRGADVKLAKELQPGAMGRIETESTNAIALRTSARGGLRLSGDDDAPFASKAVVHRPKPPAASEYSMHHSPAPVRASYRAKRAQQAMSDGPMDAAQPAQQPLSATSIEGLREALISHKSRIIDVFRIFDRNGDGRVSRGEFRIALPLLGFDASDGPLLDEIFDQIDVDGSGTVTYDELRAAFSRRENVSPPPPPASPPMTPDPGEEVEAGGFEGIMRQKALDYETADVNNDKQLDIDEFCAMVRGREVGPFSDEELRRRFDELDIDGSGTIELSEYLSGALREALHKSASRVMDLFRQWDDDGSGTVDRKEFRRAVQALGFDFFDDASEIDKVFDELDADGSGELDFRELNKALRAGHRVTLDKKLQKGAVQVKTSAAGKHKLRTSQEPKSGSKRQVASSGLNQSFKTYKDHS